MAKRIVCELCGGQNFTKQNGYYVCQSCGAQFSPEDARNMMQDVDEPATPAAPAAPAAPVAPVAAPATNDTQTHLQLARRARETDNDSEAVQYYRMVEMADPTNWEAAFYKVYCTARTCTIAHIASSATLVANSLRSVISLVAEHVPEEEMANVLRQIVEDCADLANMLLYSNDKNYEEIDLSIRSRFFNEFDQRRTQSHSIMLVLGDCLDAKFGKSGKYGGIIVQAWQYAWVFNEKYNGLDVNKIGLRAKIYKYNPAFIRPSVEKEIAEVREQLRSCESTIAEYAEPKKKRPVVATLCFVMAFFFLMFILTGAAAEEGDSSFCYIITALLSIEGVLFAFGLLPEDKKKKERREQTLLNVQNRKKSLDAYLKELEGYLN